MRRLISVQNDSDNISPSERSSDDGEQEEREAQAAEDPGKHRPL